MVRKDISKEGFQIHSALKRRRREQAERENRLRDRREKNRRRREKSTDNFYGNRARTRSERGLVDDARGQQGQADDSAYRRAREQVGASGPILPESERSFDNKYYQDRENARNAEMARLQGIGGQAAQGGAGAGGAGAGGMSLPAVSQSFNIRGNQGGQRPDIPGKGDWQRGGQQQRPQPSLGELYQDAWQSARDANEDRYGQILGGYNQLEDQAGGRLGGLLGGYAGMGSRLGGLSTQNLGAINALMNQERGGILDRAGQRMGDVQDRFGEFGQQHQDLIGRGREQHLGGLGARTSGLLTGRQGAMDRMQQLHQGRTGGMMDILSGAGDTERERIGRQFDQAQEAQEAQAEQDLISRGLGNTTIRSSVMGGIGDRTEQGKADAMNRLSEQLRGEQLGAFERGTGTGLAQLGRDLEGISMAGERLTGDQMSALERGNIRREGADMQVGMAGLGQLSDAQRAMGQMDFGLGQQGMGGLINTLGANLSGQLNLGQSALNALERGGLNVQGIGQDMLNFMERRDDQYPDIGQLIELATGAGQAGMGMGVGGGILPPQGYDPFGGLNPFGGGGMYAIPNTMPSGGGRGGAGGQGGQGGQGGAGGGGLNYDDLGSDPDFGSGDMDDDGVPDYLDRDTGPQTPPPTGGGSSDPLSPNYDPTKRPDFDPTRLPWGEPLDYDELGSDPDFGRGNDGVPEYLSRPPEEAGTNEHAQMQNYQRFLEMINRSGMGMQPGMGGMGGMMGGGMGGGGGMGIVYNPNLPDGVI